MLHFRRFPAIAVILTLPLLTGAAIAQTLEGNDDSIPYDLVLRLLKFPSGIQQELLIDQLPDNLPGDLPLPDGAKVVASVVTGGSYYRVLLDVPQSPDQVELLYQEQLEAAGWQRQSYGNRVQGFVSSGFEQTDVLFFCKDTTGPLLGVFAGSTQTSTDLQLTLSTDDSTSCNLRRVWNREIGPPMPVLVSPPDALVRRQVSGGSDNYWVSRANLETELEAEALMAHYGDQWERVGWIRIAENQTDRTLWSFWRLQDETGQAWQGTLSMSKVEEMPNQYEARAIVIE